MSLGPVIRSTGFALQCVNVGVYAANKLSEGWRAWQVSKIDQQVQEIGEKIFRMNRFHRHFSFYISPIIHSVSFGKLCAGNVYELSNDLSKLVIQMTRLKKPVPVLGSWSFAKTIGSAIVLELVRNLVEDSFAPLHSIYHQDLPQIPAGDWNNRSTAEKLDLLQGRFTQADQNFRELQEDFFPLAKQVITGEMCPEARAFQVIDPLARSQGIGRTEFLSATLETIRYDPSAGNHTAVSTVKRILQAIQHSTRLSGIAITKQCRPQESKV